MNAIIQAVSYDWLLARASNPDDGLTKVFAGVMQSAGKGEIKPPNLGMGLAPDKFTALLDSYFPGASREICGENNTVQATDCPAFRADEFDELLELLLEHRSDDAEHTVWLAHAVASGCMGGKHLYRDMGLPDRQTLSALMEHYFNALYLKNAGKMKWKKFLYKQLCERAEVKACPAPSCGVCAEYRNCFVTEDGAEVERVATGSPL
ncbi:MAG: nitrogen fixation protein NifQ [Sulfuriferula sp.]